GGEVHRPSLVGLCCGHRLLGSPHQSFSCSLAHHQPFFSIEAIDLLVVHDLSTPSQTPAQPLVPIPRQLRRQGSQSFPQLGIWWSTRPVLPRRPRQTEQFAASSFAHSVPLDRVRSFATIRRRRHHFFELTSFRIWLSSTSSATMRLSRTFSAMSSRNRFASLTSRPPYFWRHR